MLLEPALHSKRSRRNEKPAHRSWRVAPTLQLERARTAAKTRCSKNKLEKTVIEGERSVFLGLIRVPTCLQKCGSSSVQLVPNPCVSLAFQVGLLFQRLRNLRRVCARRVTSPRLEPVCLPGWHRMAGWAKDSKTVSPEGSSGCVSEPGL